MKINHYSAILAISALFAACKGDTGPQGPAGISNISTATFSVNYWNTTISPTSWFASYTESAITDFNNDAVEVYFGFPNSTNWVGLPYSNLDATGDQLSYQFNNDLITINYDGNNEPPSFYTNTTPLYFKVTVIPPAIMVKHPGTNWKNAAEVAQLPEVQAALNKSK